MCRACRYLYPEEYKKSLRQLRTRRASTYAVQTSANFEDDLNKAYSDLHTKESVASRTKTIQLKFDDYKEVNYLQDLLVDKDVKGPEGSIEEFTFDEAEYPIMKIGDRPFEAYNPPVPSLNDQIISRFSAYFDLFAPSATQITDRPKWTLEGALEYMHAHQASQPASDTEITTILEVLSSTSTTQPRSIIDADIVSLLVSNDSASDSFLHENAKTYKTSGTGLPNALLVTPMSIIVGMSKSQVLFFPNRASDSPSPFFATPTSPSDSLPSSAPFVHGSPENCADIGSVLSLGADASGGVCAIGYSSGAIDVLSVDRHTLLKSFASVHATAVVFVRVLSNESILSADYDGNVNVTSYTRKLFSAAVNSVRVFQAAQFGQVFDLSVLPFSVRRCTLKRTDSVRNGEGGMVNREETFAADLVAITHREATQILLADQGETRVLFTLPRGTVEVSNASPFFESKTNYVQSSVSTAWRRGERNSFQFMRCDTNLIEIWSISVLAGVSLNSRRS